MRGQGMNRQHGRGRASAGRRIASALVCGCSRCGYMQAHTPGVPCREAICPHCGVPLLKMDATGQVVTQNREFQKGNIQNSSFSGAGNNAKSELRNEERATGESNQSQAEIPVIDTSKCTGCGTCVDVCRRDAIKLVNGVVQIIPELCINCRLCVRKCPEGAIQ
ncbi:MAG: 4Fe-4S binding protein [Prolixibacteraceae bacterium]|jgi:NAD-dependent dihydropyrimidine dehydrogenase PreA subunit|nr:4Fe-4S binding protein [Prolixibacteraceae bacterium]